MSVPYCSLLSSLSLLDVCALEVGEMRNRAAKGSEAQLERDPKNFARGAGLGR